MRYVLNWGIWNKFANPHLFDQTIKAFVMLYLIDRSGGKKSVQQLLLMAKKLQLLFSWGQR